jgi:hypothetical protein
MLKMEAVLKVIYGLVGAGMLICFLASFAAHILLQFYIDHDRIKKELGEPGWKVLGSMQASVDFYKPQAAWLWRVRRTGFAGFFIGGGVIILVALLSAAFAAK